MTEQQQDLLQVLEQQSLITADIEQLNIQTTEKEELLSEVLAQQESIYQDILHLRVQIKEKEKLFFKRQGVSEYLTHLGVTLPEPEVSLTEESLV